MVNKEIFERLLEELIAAEIANSWKGGGDPEDIPEIERNLEASRSAMNAYMKTFFSKRNSNGTKAN